jgi:ligand-binding sensor domain-containing protein/signal transduction histidine kinase
MRKSDLKTVIAIPGPGLRLLLSLFILQFSSLQALALDPQKTLNQYSHETRTNQNGLPGEAVNEIVQTPDGYLWLRTASGLIRFDGVRFARIEPRIGRIGKEPLHETIRAICSSAGGDLLVRSDTKTLIYRNSIFSHYTLPSPTPDGAILKIFETKGKQVWIGSDNFVYQVRHDGIGQALGKTGWATAFLEDHVGNLWIATASGLFKYSDGGFTQYSTEFHQAFIESTGQVNRLSPGRHPIKGRVTALAEDRQGNLWVGTRDGLYRILKGDILAGSPVRQLKGQHISAIKEDKHGNLWVGTDASGLYLMANGKWSSMNAGDGLTDDTVLSLFEDREGSIWVGTKSGLDRFRNSKIIPFTTREGLAHNNAVSIIEARDGSLYIFSAGGGLTRLRDGKATVFTIRDGLASNYGGPLFESRDGSIWIGTDRGLCRLKDNKITTYQAQGRLSRFSTSSITEDEESLIVCTSEIRAFRFRDGRLSEYRINGEPNPFTGKYVFTTTRDQSGDLWFGTTDGLYRITRGRPPVRNLIGHTITSITDDQRGSLWLGGRMPGLVRVRTSDGRITRYTMLEGLFDNEVQSALSDKDGNLWVSTPRGIFTVSRSDLDDFAEGRSKTIRSTPYNIADGMKTIDCSSHIQPSGWRGRDGRLWFTTRKGIVLIDPKNFIRNEIPPPVAIEEVIVEGESFPPDNFTELEPDKKRFEFHYNGLSLLIPERVRFKYQLEGYDRDWIDAGTRRVAYYTNLAPGRYRFRVIASNNDGVWNEDGASYKFSLTPHFYQRSWFFLSCAALVALMGLGIHRLIIGQMKARFMAVLAERKRIASELHDTVEQGLSMILLHLESGAARMSESPQAARQHLELARQMVKHSLIETRHSVLELYSQELDNRDLVSALAQLIEKLTTGTSIETDVRVNGVSRNLPAVAGHHLLLLCQEAITNALKHANARRVTIALNFEPQTVEVSVQDDGCGFDPDSPLHLSGGHFGLVGMRERIKKLGGRLTLNSRPGTGTEVVIMVPTN